jgi:hypothetical protein
MRVQPESLSHESLEETVPPFFSPIGINIWRVCFVLYCGSISLINCTSFFLNRSERRGEVISLCKVIRRTLEITSRNDSSTLSSLLSLFFDILDLEFSSEKCFCFIFSFEVVWKCPIADVHYCPQRDYRMDSNQH